MARFKDKNEALKLRRQGMSYSQIKKILGVGKGTLSAWLREYPLSKERIRELRDRNEVRIEKFRETMRLKKTNRLSAIYKKQGSIVLPLSKRDLFIAGLFLYWGEGSKSQTCELGISNTDPSMIKFFIKWLSKCFSVPKERLSIQLQLYSDMDMEKEINFWTNATNISRDQFIKPYIKNSLLSGINHKGGFGHGTCCVKIRDVKIAEKVLMTLKVIADQYN